MKKLSLFLLVTYSSFALAQKPPYDTNCVDHGKKWGWIKSFDAGNGHKREYANPDVIEKSFSANQDKQIKQLDIWNDVDASVPCLKDHAGLTFQKGKMIIFNMVKFTQFRLNGSKINCLVSVADTRTTKHVDDIDSRHFNRIKDPRVIAADSTDTPAIRANIRKIARSVDIAESHKAAEVLREKLKQNNNLGDLGMESYCSHQLRLGIAMDKSQTLMADFKICDDARAAGKNSILTSPVCKGYPNKNQKDLDNIAEEIKKIKEKKSGWQPLVRINEADNDIYSKFENNLQKLKLAQKQAGKSMNMSYAADNFLKSNNMNADLHSVVDCGKRDELISDQFSKGIICDTPYSPLTTLKTEFKPDIAVLKKLHEQNLITELNAHAFGEAMKSKYYLLKDDSQKVKMFKQPALACAEMAGKDLCKGPYLAAFKKSINEAWNYKTPHFLSYTKETVVDYYNARLANLQTFCTSFKDSKKNGMIEIKPEHYKAFEENFNQLISGEVSQYLYDDGVRYATHLDHFRNSKGQYCEGFEENTIYSIADKQIEHARQDFEKATDEQIKISGEFSAPNRGDPSNLIGTLSCGISRSDKNDSYALNSLYESHPFLAGKTLKGLEKNDRRVYATVLCDAKECNEKVENSNDNIKSAAKVALIAANLLPGGSIVSLVGMSAIGVAEEVNHKLHADHEADKMKRGIASDGLEPVYSQKIQDVLKDLAIDGNVGKLITDIAIHLASEIAVFKGAHYLTHSFAHTMHIKGIHLSPTQIRTVDIIMHKALAKADHMTKDKIAEALNEVTEETIEAPNMKPKEL